MKENLIKYTEGLGGGQSVLDWIDKRVSDDADISETEHIIDYLLSDKAPKRLGRATYEQMKDKAEKWTKSLEKKGESIKELKGDIEVVLDFKDGFKFVKLVGENAYKREGFLMRHCVSSYYGKDDEIYSLRDKKNMPHATLSKNSQQIKGKGNGSIHPKYVKYVVEFLEHVGVEVRDSEMKNLGYVNIEDVKDKNAVFPEDSLFKGKYFYKNDMDKIVDKNNEKYENLTLWSVFGLFSFNSNLEVKFNFSVANSISTFVKNLKKKKDYSQLAGGNRSQLAGGDDSQLAGGDDSQLAGGDYSQLAGGNRSQLAGGNRSQLAGGDYSQLAGGNRSQLAGGDDSQLAGGYDSQLAGGNRSQLAGGDGSQLELKGEKSVAIADNRSRVKGKIGSFFALCERGDEGEITSFIAEKVDGENVKEDVWYCLKDGKLQEWYEGIFN